VARAAGRVTARPAGAIGPDCQRLYAALDCHSPQEYEEK
jgi:hypothetical protein